MQRPSEHHAGLGVLAGRHQDEPLDVVIIQRQYQSSWKAGTSNEKLRSWANPRSYGGGGTPALARHLPTLYRQGRPGAPPMMSGASVVIVPLVSAWPQRVSFSSSTGSWAWRLALASTSCMSILSHRLQRSGYLCFRHQAAAVHSLLAACAMLAKTLGPAKPNQRESPLCSPTPHSFDSSHFASFDLGATGPGRGGGGDAKVGLDPGTWVLLHRWPD